MEMSLSHEAVADVLPSVLRACAYSANVCGFGLLSFEENGVGDCL